MLFSQNERKSLEAQKEICDFLEKTESGVSARIHLNEIAMRYTGTKKRRFLYGCCKEELLNCLEKLSENQGLESAEACKTLVEEMGKCTDGREIYGKCTQTLCKAGKTLETMQTDYNKKYGLYPRLGAVFGVLICLITI